MAVAKAGAQLVHVDVRTAFLCTTHNGFRLVKSLSAKSPLPLDVHL
jgi:pentose-5-phosphate-3-epimerase